MPPPDPNEPNPELTPGLRLLDRYTIIDHVASGGMASIYRATDERLERVVCVKLLRLVLEGSGSASGPGLYQATYTHFLQEALALSRLQHPNTLRIYDFGYTGDDRPFQISEFLDGGNLETQVRASGRFTNAETLAVLERICGAVAEAHQHGIIHRDIKPSNILFARVARAGETAQEREVGQALVPKLADFGIASSRVRRASELELDKVPAVSSVALFSPRWAAPEQLSSSVEGPATDVYALGLVTGYMLSGRAPFADSDVRAHFDDRIRGDDFATERLRRLALPERVEEVLRHAMAADPARRIPTPIAFHAELSAALADTAPESPVSSRRPYESITLVVEPPIDGRHGADEIAPPERTVVAGTRRVRIVEMSEKLDFTLHAPTWKARDPLRVVRFRAALLPSPGPEGFSLHVKGLNCFVVRVARSSRNPGKGTGGRPRPTPAITASEDGEADLVSGEQEPLVHVIWSFGRPSEVGPDAGRVFTFGTAELVVPFSQASRAVAIDLGPEREAIVMCTRT